MTLIDQIVITNVVIAAIWYFLVSSAMTLADFNANKANWTYVYSFYILGTGIGSTLWALYAIVWRVL